jgi:hypothetical protein
LTAGKRRLRRAAVTGKAVAAATTGSEPAGAAATDTERARPGAAPAAVRAAVGTTPGLAGPVAAGACLEASAATTTGDDQRIGRIREVHECAAAAAARRVAVRHLRLPHAAHGDFEDRAGSELIITGEGGAIPAGRVRAATPLRPVNAEGVHARRRDGVLLDPVVIRKLIRASRAGSQGRQHPCRHDQSCPHYVTNPSHAHFK